MRYCMADLSINIIVFVDALSLRQNEEVRRKMSYKLQRFLVSGRGKGKWTTIQTSKSKKKIEIAYRGWKAQLRGGAFRIKSPSGRIVKRRDSVLSKAIGRS
jgi:hypothetical protein